MTDDVELTETEVCSCSNPGETHSRAIHEPWFETAVERAVADRLAAAASADVVEEWGVRWVDEPDKIQRMPKERVDRKASRAHGDVIYRRTRTVIVTDWEVVDD